MKIYVSVKPDRLPKGVPFIELDHKGLPLHPKYLIPRVQAWIEHGDSFATVSELACIVPGRMIRMGLISCGDVRIHHIDEDGHEMVIEFDSRGDFIQPWPEDGFESLMNADFHLRYA